MHITAWLARLVTQLRQWIARMLFPPTQPASKTRRRRVSVLLQMSTIECGAGCLAMLLSYYGRETQVAECRALLGTGREGFSARTFLQAARSYGLRARALSLEPADFPLVPLPAIAHW